MDTPEPQDRLQLPTDPSRWTAGDWSFEDKWDEDEDWAKPEPPDTPEEKKRLHRRIGTEAELLAVADAIVRGYEITESDPRGETRVIVGEFDDEWGRGHGLTEHVAIENLRALILAVQAHPAVRLARVEVEEEANGGARVVRRWVTDREGEELCGVAWPTTLRLEHSIVARALGEVEGYGGPDIEIAVRATARFHTTDWFRGTHFRAAAWFVGARFHADAWFHEACFYADARFDDARFQADAWFFGACFHAVARFVKARFHADACFNWTCFHADAELNRACFHAVAWFDGAWFHAVAQFEEARFHADAGFVEARFRADARFFGARFHAVAWFVKARFHADARFGDARFHADARFEGARVRRRGRLLFVGTRFSQSVSFDPSPFEPDEPQRALLRGGVYFTRATLDERLTFDDAYFGQRARLGFKRFLARGGATIELSAEQLRLAIIEGGDSDDPAAMALAAEDYELLAANYARQPATDKEEDGCRWMAHEIRRRAGWLRTRAAILEFMHAPFDRGRVRWLARREEGPLVWYLEYFAVIWSCVPAFGAFALSAMWSWVWNWLIKRTIVGYLLQPQRMAVSGGVVILACAVLYGVFAGDHTIASGGNAAAPPPWEVDGWCGRACFGLSFSLTTFVTLGYGDYAPTGWFKLVTSLEALLGVMLLSLFTVAWGRKLVR